MSGLGRLERVDLRTIWTNEAHGFTPWLARADNLKLLGEAIGIELELEGQERDVGPFRADILCKNADDGSWVLIENQLEKTDHLHYGQLLTYAAGLDAVTVIWIAGRFIEEHRAALDWLNRITADNFRFFGLEVELWKIDASLPAPKFNIVTKPNDWVSSVGQAARSIASSATDGRQERYLAYWTALYEYMTAITTTLRIRKPEKHNWFSVSVGMSNITLTAFAKSRDKSVSVAIIIRNAPNEWIFVELSSQKMEIEAELGYNLSWEPRQQAGMRWYIEVRKDNVNPLDQSDWPNQHAWIAERMEEFSRAFRPRIEARKTHELGRSGIVPSNLRNIAAADVYGTVP